MLEQTRLERLNQGLDKLDSGGKQYIERLTGRLFQRKEKMMAIKKKSSLRNSVNSIKSFLVIMLVILVVLSIGCTNPSGSGNNDIPTVAAPTAGIAPGVVASGTTITLATATSGASIYYTTDGTTPSKTNGTMGTLVYITAAVTIKAIAVKDGMKNSGVLTAAYTISAPSPTPSTPPSAPPSPTPSTPPSAPPSPTPSTPPSAPPSPTPSTPPSAPPSPTPSTSPSAPPSPTLSPSPTPTPGSLGINIGFDFGTITILGSNGINIISKGADFSKPTSITLSASGYTGVQWYVDGVLKTGATGNSITLTAAAYDIRKHSVTFTGIKDSVPYSQLIPFTVVQ